MAEKRFPKGMMASCPIPWDEDRQLVEGLFREEVRLTLAATKLIYIMGTAGEGYAVSDSQFAEVTKVFAEEMRKGGAEPIVGIISISLSQVQERIEVAKGMGVGRFQISLPAWGACSQAEVYDFFEAVCAKHRDCQFMHYNLVRTKRLVTPQEYAVLEEAHPNLVATKNSSDSLRDIAALLSTAKRLQHFMTDIAYLHGALIGECGLLMSMCTTNWRTAEKMFDAGKNRDYAEALAYQQELIAFNADLRAFVAPWGHIDGAYDKLFVKLHLPDFPLRLLPPYHSVPEEAFEDFRSMLREKYPRWNPA